MRLFKPMQHDFNILSCDNIICLRAHSPWEHNSCLRVHSPYGRAHATQTDLVTWDHHLPSGTLAMRT